MQIRVSTSVRSIYTKTRVTLWNYILRTIDSKTNPFPIIPSSEVNTTTRGPTKSPNISFDIVGTDQETRFNCKSCSLIELWNSTELSLAAADYPGDNTRCREILVYSKVCCVTRIRNRHGWIHTRPETSGTRDADIRRRP